MTKLYVGNLPYKFRDEDLGSLFSSFGTVHSSSIIMDRATRRSKGFGFVELDDDAAQAAIAEMNGREIEGRNLTVNVARPMEKREDRDDRRY